MKRINHKINERKEETLRYFQRIKRKKRKKEETIEKEKP